MQRKSFNPVIDNTYNAKAGQNFADILDDKAEHIVNLVYAYQVILMIFTWRASCFTVKCTS